MQIIQEQRTIIKAEDGKVLRKKRDGRVVGDTVHLGYDYYEAGILLKEPHLSTPDDYEEIDMITELNDEGVEVKVIPQDNTFKRLQMLNKVLQEETISIQDYNLTNEEMLSVKNLFPRLNENIKEGDEVNEGFVFLFKAKLYKVLQTHVIKSHYFPSENTKHLYEEII